MKGGGGAAVRGCGGAGRLGLTGRAALQNSGSTEESQGAKRSVIQNRKTFNKREHHKLSTEKSLTLLAAVKLSSLSCRYLILLVPIPV